MERKKVVLPLAAALAAIGFFSYVGSAAAASDPGVRGGAAGAGGPINGLTANQQAFFDSGLDEFSDADDVPEGLGPTMNLDSCAGCHAAPAVGGSSPAVNPQVAFANAATPSQLPAVAGFISATGPVREARFVKNADGTNDGGVHALFTITGREGADGCNLAQPNFATQLTNKNVIFRIPTPLFGAGLIEQITDDAIQANAAANASAKASLGIFGHVNFFIPGRVTGTPNTNGNDGTVTRFGWKAQNKSLMVFSGEAYNVEMGVTNENFQNERDETVTCQFAPVPNTMPDFDAATAIDHASPIEKFSNFQRFLAPPTPSLTTPGGSTSIGRGKATFSNIGCALCHTPSLQTDGFANVAALRNQTVNLFSDLVVHDMGDGLADGVTQGGAGPREFRSAPLWGLGQRIFFLHDGRTSNLNTAIQAHSSNGSEANGVISKFNNLFDFQKQDVLNFLRSL